MVVFTSQMTFVSDAFRVWYSSFPLMMAMLRLVIVDYDEVHLFSSLAAKQGGVSCSSTTINFTMYFISVFGFSTSSLQVPSPFIFTLFHISKEILEGLVGLSLVWLLGMIQTVVLPPFRRAVRKIEWRWRFHLR